MKKLHMSYEGTLRKHINIHGTLTDIEVYSILKAEFHMPQNS